MNTFKCNILTPEKTLFDADVQSVKAPGSSGHFEILAHHCNFISTLSNGILKINTGKEETCFSIEKGVLEFSKNQVTILIDGARRLIL